MSVVDTFLKKMRMVSDDDYEDYDDYDDYADNGDEDEDIISQKRVKAKQKVREEEYDDYGEEPEETPKKSAAKSAAKSSRTFTKAVKPQKPASGYGQNYQSGVSSLHTVRKDESMNNVCMIMPKGFDDANLIADKLTEGCGVIMNLEGIDMGAAQRIIDFASGACYAVNGNLQKISKKIFMAVPGDVNLSGDFDELIDDTVGLNSVSMK